MKCILKNKLDTTIKLSEQEKILADYYQFFTDPKGIDMLPYAYMGSSSTYDLMVKNNPDYYLFSEEVAIIKNNAEKLTTHLSDIKDIIEIGPGSNHTITNKTIPLLNYAKSLKRYYAIDHSKPYLDKACAFIKENTYNIDIRGVEADLMSLGNLKSLKKEDDKKCILLLGGTIGNFSSSLQLQALQQIFKLMNIGDKLLLAVDTNQDEQTLIKAYDNIYSYKLIRGILEYFAIIHPPFKDYLNFFEIRFLWHKHCRTIEKFFVAKENIIFEMEKYGTIAIRQNQELRGAASQKFTLMDINNLLHKIGFGVLDILNYNNKVRLIICKKP
ncbi:hypothetical protein NOVO_05715 [Rickettsiales bacterium Ac37b]|nr:hypothetical protein NOVO_04395 [Rickettsiales bacterium Ac37b]AIL65506.1 hypothetical protein NOVO_05715 [Rickettsiales bacterium Ac37b]